MIDSLQWLLGVELIGLAFLPLTLWLLRSLPDRGYAFGKILGILLVTYATWLAGNVLPIGNSPTVPVIAALCAATVWWICRRDIGSVLHEIRTLVIIEEALFLSAFAGWTLLRAQVFGGSIGH